MDCLSVIAMIHLYMAACALSADSSLR